LQELGWTIGRNMRIDYRWGASSPDNTRKYAAELAALAPDVMLASGTIALAAVQQISHTIPVVFVNLIDPVSGGFVESLARPGGNTTGFLLFEYGISGKWLELLKEVAPRVTRAAVIRDPDISSGTGQFGALQSVAPSFGMELSPINLRDVGEIERAVARDEVTPAAHSITSSARASTEKADHRHRGLLRASRERPRCSAAEQRPFRKNSVSRPHWHSAIDRILMANGRFRGEADVHGRVASATSFVSNGQCVGP
jgi:putative ABC transport system substrate-binding protein